MLQQVSEHGKDLINKNDQEKGISQSNPPSPPHPPPLHLNRCCESNDESLWTRQERTNTITSVETAHIHTRINDINVVLHDLLTEIKGIKTQQNHI